MYLLHNNPLKIEELFCTKALKMAIDKAAIYIFKYKTKEISIRYVPERKSQCINLKGNIQIHTLTIPDMITYIPPAGSPSLITISSKSKLSNFAFSYNQQVQTVLIPIYSQIILCCFGWVLRRTKHCKGYMATVQLYC